ncbi:MAG: hypothetical protein HC850_10510, partial [Rhodomicrobium sp.]|nr:hypothetical protein [Rhodomicrobium sp.]
DFRRVRIGIGHPGDKLLVTGHVLGDFSKADQEWLDPLLAAIAAAAPALVDSDAKFTSAVAQRLAPPKPEKKRRRWSPPRADARRSACSFMYFTMCSTSRGAWTGGRWPLAAPWKSWS